MLIEDNSGSMHRIVVTESGMSHVIVMPGPCSCRQSYPVYSWVINVTDTATQGLIVLCPSINYWYIKLFTQDKPLQGHLCAHGLS